METELLGSPFAIQNTTGSKWLVSWEEAVTHTGGESVSFTVAISRGPDLTIADLQRHALKRAVELLRMAIDNPPPD